MLIKSLSLIDFKNAENDLLHFSDSVNVIYGENASGKTNLLESIFFFASGKSFRGCKEKDLIQFGKETTSADLIFNTNNQDYKMTVHLSKNQKRQIFVNDNKVVRISEYLGLFRAVVFTPDHLNLIKGIAPARRKFLDLAICQSFPRYASSLNEYQKLLIQKNALLKNQNPNRKLLEVYNERMAELAGIITYNRYRYVLLLSEISSSFQHDMSRNGENMEIRYISQVPAFEKSSDEIKKSYDSLFEEKLEREIQYSSALYGIQKDDFEVQINKKNTKLFGSQGQQKSAVLSMKLAEGEISKRLTGEYPVFLLDDILSELDNYRREYILSKIFGKQVILTGCEPELFHEYQNANKIFVSNGKAENI